MGIRDALRVFAGGVAGAALDAFEKAAAPADEDSSADDEGGDDDSGSGKEGGKGGSDTLPVTPLVPAEIQDRQSLKHVPEGSEEMGAAKGDPQALLFDPFAIVDALGYKDKPSPISYATLRAMVWRMPIIQGIHRTRISQVQMFSRPQVDKYSTGYRVVLKDRKQRPTPGSERYSQTVERWLATTGTTEDPRNRDDFDAFLSKLVSDSLTYDAFTFETVPSDSGKPATFYAIDASTVRYADSTKLFIDPEDGEAIRYVQIYDGSVVSEFTGSMLCYGVRNPSTNIQLQGYGQSELEMLITTVTSLLWAWDYNQRFFSQGAGVKGILNFKGKIPDKHLRAFRRHWYSMVAGVENAFRTPIMNAEDMQWVNLQASNRDMEFNAWMDFLIKVASSIYLIDPMEVNFKYGDTGQKAMFESSNNAKLTASKDKGLRPLLNILARKVSKHLVEPLDPDFEFEFVGLESQTPNEQADLNTKLVKTTRTVDELRALEDLPPLPNGLGDIILDPVYFQHLQAAAGALNQQANPQEGLDDLGNPLPAPPPAPGENGFGGDDDSGTGDDLDGLPGYEAKKKPPALSGKQAPEGTPAPAEKSMRKSREPAKLVVEFDF
jgi:hypothetical protein